MTIPLSIAAVALLTIATLVDLRRRQLPNRYTYPAIVLAMVAAIAGGHVAVSLLAAAVLGGWMLFALLVSPTSIGGGDVKMAVAVGLLVGWPGINVAILVMIVASIAGLVVMKLRRMDALPYGPVLLAGCVAGMVAQ